MVQEKVTREELKNMHIGQTRIIQLAEKKKIESARQTVRQVGYENDMEFVFKPDREAVAVSITRTK